jgi:hypothetical protein
VAFDLDVEGRGLDVDGLLLGQPPVDESRPRRVAAIRDMQRCVAEPVRSRHALDGDVGVPVEREVLLQLGVSPWVRLECKDAAGYSLRRAQAVQPDVGTDVDEVPAGCQKPLDQAQLELIAEAEEVVAMKRFREIEPKARAEQLDAVHPGSGQADVPSEATLARKLEPSRDGQDPVHGPPLSRDIICKT